MGVIAKVRPVFQGHHGGIWIGGADLEIGLALIASSHDLPIWSAIMLKPIMSVAVLLTQLLCERGRQVRMEQGRDSHFISPCRLGGTRLTDALIALLSIKEHFEMLFNGNTRFE